MYQNFLLKCAKPEHDFSGFETPWENRSNKTTEQIMAPVQLNSDIRLAHFIPCTDIWYT